MRFVQFLSLLATFVAFVNPAQAADDTALYDPAPPADSAFVRIINATGATVDATVGGASYSGVTAPGISSYRIIPQGEQEVKIGDFSEKLNIAAGKYYSLALTEKDGKKELTPLDDAIIKNPAKAMVYFYNLSDAPTSSLHAVKQKADIIADVKPGTSGSREVNALTIDVGVNAEGKEIKSFPGVELKRRTGVSFLLSGTGTGKQALMAASDIAAK